MIDLKCKRRRRRRRRRRSNQFNNVLLIVQDKVNYSKITEIREKGNANSILYWFGHALCLRPVLK